MYIYDVTMLELYMSIFSIFLAIGFFTADYTEKAAEVYGEIANGGIWGIAFLVPSIMQITGWVFGISKIRYAGVSILNFIFIFLATVMIFSGNPLAGLFFFNSIFQFFVWYRHKSMREHY
jgi:hypothetical protein